MAADPLDADSLMPDAVALVRTTTDAGRIIATFSNPALVSLEVLDRELEEVARLHARMQLLLARILARWLAAPVTPGTTRH